MVVFDLHCRVASLDEFKHIIKLCADMDLHYSTHPKDDYVVTVNRVSNPDGFAASAVHVDSKDWRTAFSHFAANSGE